MDRFETELQTFLPYLCYFVWYIYLCQEFYEYLKTILFCKPELFVNLLVGFLMIGSRLYIVIQTQDTFQVFQKMGMEIPKLKEKIIDRLKGSPTYLLWQKQDYVSDHIHVMFFVTPLGPLKRLGILIWVYYKSECGVINVIHVYAASIPILKSRI